jgi:hypothetical protein
MLSNCKVSVNKSGNIVVEILTGITHDKKMWEAIDDLKKNDQCRLYIPDEGSKYKPALWVAEYRNDNGNYFRRYEEINVNGITIKLQVRAKIEESELNRIAEYKSIHEQEVRKQEEENKKAMLEDENKELKERLARMEAMMAKLMPEDDAKKPSK